MNQQNFFQGTTVHKSNQSLKRTLQNTVKLMPILAFFLSMPMAYSEEEEIIEEQIVVGDLNSLPGENIDSVFGFGKSILETPRSVSTISEEMMDRFNMQDIDELIAVSPGSPGVECLSFAISSVTLKPGNCPPSPGFAP